jgi:hypothetical protein
LISGRPVVAEALADALARLEDPGPALTIVLEAILTQKPGELQDGALIAETEFVHAALRYASVKAWAQVKDPIAKVLTFLVSPKDANEEKELVAKAERQVRKGEKRGARKIAKSNCETPYAF